MKKFILPVLAIPLASFTLLAFADDAEVVLSRSKKLEEMEFRSKQLAFQASIAESFKKMKDAEFLIDDDGKLVGVPDMNKLGTEIRQAQSQSTPANGDMPFNMNPPGMPMGAPFTLEQPPMGPGLVQRGTTQYPSQPPQLPLLPPGAGAPGAPGAASAGASLQNEPPKEDVPEVLRLTEIRSNSVLIGTNNGLSEVKVGQKINNLTLKRIDVNSAYFTGPKGPQVLKFDWTSSSRYGS